MRLFIAIPIPDDIKDYLRELQGMLPKKGIFLNDHFHLTLQFLGEEIAPEKLDDIKKAIAKTFETAMPKKLFLFQLKTMQTFKNRYGAVRVIWVGMKISRTLMEFQQVLESNLAEIGFKNEKSFIPHLTLARVKLPQTSKLEEAINHIQVQDKTFEVSEIYIIQTILKPEGATYKVIQKYMWEEER